ncbi:glycosyltransferase, partial [Actinomycetota bacterium]
HTENFGIVVAEALSYGVPVIVSTGAPWSGIVDNHCGWWTPKDDASLAGALTEAMSATPEQLSSAGRRGQTWMATDFTWAKIAAETTLAYRWILDPSLEMPASLQS